MIKIVLKFIPFLLLLLFACEEMPDEPKFIDIIEDMESSISISITDSSDSLIIWGTKNINFYVGVNDQIVDTCKILLDDIVVASRKGGNKTINKIRFESEKYADGWHKLRYFTYSHLKPNKERQYYVYFSDTLETNIKIDNSIPTTYEITKIEPVNGKLQVNWQKYEGIGFQEYSLYKKGYTEYEFKLLATITNAEVVYWRDPEYIGSESSYFIKLLTKNKTITSKTKNVNYSIPSLSAKNIKNKSIELKWDKCLFDSALESIDIYRYLNGPYENNKSKIPITTPNVTTHLDKDPIFGRMLYYKLHLQNKKNNYVLKSNFASSYYGYRNPGLGEENFYNYDLGENINYDYENKIIFYSTVVLDATNMQLIYQHDAPFSLSQDCKSAYYVKDHYIVSVNPLTGNVIKEYNIKNIVGTNIDQIQSLLVTNNGRAIFMGLKFREPALIGQGVYYVDLYSGKVLLTLDTRHNTPLTKITSDGKFIFKAKKIYKYSETNGLEKIIDLNSPFFIYPKKNSIITTNNHMIQVIDLETGQVTSSVPIEKSISKPIVDFEKNVIGGTTWSEYLIYDLSTGKKIVETKTNSSNVWMVDDKLISASGYYLPIEY